MSFASTHGSSLLAGALRSPLTNAKPFETSAPVAPLLSVRASNSVIIVLTRTSSFSPVAIDIARSVNRPRVIDGSTERLRNCCRFRTVMSSSRSPGTLAPLVRQNTKLMYNLLFRCVSQTLLAIGRDPSRLGADLGFLAVLHTWNQKMMTHPHLHCLVPAGGLSPDRSRWVHSRRRFFLPGPVLGRMFRGKFLALLAVAFRRKKLRLVGELQALERPGAFDLFVSSLKKPKWVVEVRAPFGGPEHVLKYLARYTHRIAISNGRLVELRDGQVTFRWRDSADHNTQKLMTIEVVEFIRRFLLHVLPPGFVKIRHFGFLSNRNRRSMLSLCRTFLNIRPCTPDSISILSNEQRSAIERRCPFCHAGALHIVEWLSADQMLTCSPDRSPAYSVDSS